MELQKKDQQKKLTWREIYLEETLNALRKNSQRIEKLFSTH